MFILLHRAFNHIVDRVSFWWYPLFFVLGFALWFVGSAVTKMSLESLLYSEGLPGIGAFYRQTKDYAFFMQVFFAFVSAVFVSSYRRYQRKYVDTQMNVLATIEEAARTSMERNQCQLESLQLRLSPHFLFNSLNAVSAVARNNDCERAADISRQLRELLLYAIDSSHMSEVSLEKEIEFTKRYVALQDVRFEGKFEVRFDESLTESNAFCPPFSIQTLVENAYYHSELVESGSVKILVKITTGEEGLEIEVTNSPAATGLRSNGMGTGINNLKKRLFLIYRNDAYMQSNIFCDTHVSKIRILPAINV